MTHPFYIASRYIESIRHPAKKRYAHDYYQWIRAGRIEPSPDCGKLSVMAAQAVRMNLNDILPEAQPTT